MANEGADDHSYPPGKPSGSTSRDHGIQLQSQFQEQYNKQVQELYADYQSTLQRERDQMQLEKLAIARERQVELADAQARDTAQQNEILQLKAQLQEQSRLAAADVMPSQPTDVPSSTPEAHPNPPALSMPRRSSESSPRSTTSQISTSHGRGRRASNRAASSEPVHGASVPSRDATSATLSGRSSRMVGSPNPLPSSQRSGQRPRGNSSSLAATPSAVTSARRLRDGKVPDPPQLPVHTGTPRRASSPVVRRQVGPSDAHRQRKMDMPKGAQPTIKAFWLHISILWLNLANEVPTAPNPSTLKKFHSRFTSSDQLKEVNDKSPPAVRASFASEVDRIKRGGGPRANKLRAMETDDLEYLDAVCARFGLCSWCPDLAASAYSLFNAAHRLVCLKTFRQLVAGGAYDVYGVDRSFVGDMGLLIRYYDHYVHYLQKNRFDQDVRQVGSVRAKEERNSNYQRRKRRADLRKSTAIQSKLPGRYLHIIKDPKAHSDDELDPETGHLVATRKPYRSAEAEALMRRLDEIKINMSRLMNGRVPAINRIIKPLDQRPVSQLFRLPTSVALDYYDPVSYNTMSPKVKAYCAREEVIVFPRNLSEIGTRSGAERFRDEELVEMHGDEVFDRYERTIDEPSGDGSDDGDFLFPYDEVARSLVEQADSEDDYNDDMEVDVGEEDEDYSISASEAADLAEDQNGFAKSYGDMEL